MGKPAKPMKKKKLIAPVNGTLESSSASTSTRQLSVEQLLKKAHDYEDKFETNESLRLYNRVLKLLEGNPSSLGSDLAANSPYTQALQFSAFNLLELGQPQKAKERLLKLLQHTKSPDYEVFMYLGQLFEADQSLSYYRQGLEALQRISADTTILTAYLEQSGKTVDSLQRAESNAFCAIAELYMTDLCDIPEARNECQKAIEGAIQTDPTNPQAWLTSANFSIVTVDTQAAKEAVERCLALWWPKLETFLADDQDARSTEAEVNQTASDDTCETQPETSKLELEEITGIPTTGLISLSRMMIELEMYERCATLLEALLEEEEDNLEVYYLLTVVGRKLWLEDDPDLLRFYATTAKVIAGKLGDLEMVGDMDALINELPPVAELDSVKSSDLSSSSDEADAEIGEG